MLPIELGQVNGLRTQLQIVGLPGGAENAPTRKQLLDRVDGVVLIVDSQPALLAENVRSIGELRESLAAYGRTLDDIPVVVQYNKRDLSDPYTIEELHRRLGLPGAAVFEGVAPQGTGVLQTLTTISKRVIRVLRESDYDALPAAPEPTAVSARPAVAARSVAAPLSAAVTPVTAPAPSPAAAARARGALVPTVDLMEQAILDEGDDQDRNRDADGFSSVLDEPRGGAWAAVVDERKNAEGARIGADFELVSVGTATRDGHRAVRVPLVLGNAEGETVTLALTIQLEPLFDDGDPL